MTHIHHAVSGGSGVDASVALSLPAPGGWSVAMCERNELPGDTICTGEDDPCGGDRRVDQFAARRSLASAAGHASGIEGLRHISASTRPGPGPGGGSGYLVASLLPDQQGHRAWFGPSWLSGD